MPVTSEYTKDDNTVTKQGISTTQNQLSSFSSANDDTDCVRSISYDSTSGGNLSKNKSKSSKKMHHISRDSLTLSSISSSVTASPSPEFLNSFPGSSVSINSQQNQLVPLFTLKVLDELVKFQRCLLNLSNTVGSLHDSLKLIIPGLSTTSSTMSASVARSFGRKTFSQPNISLENNNIIKDIKLGTSATTKETVLSISSSNCAFPSRETVTTSLESSSFSFDDQEKEIQNRGRSNNTKEQRERPSYFANVISKLVKYIGLFLALSASICISLVTLVVKFLEGYHPVSKVMWRLQGVLLPSLIIVLYVKFYKKKSLIESSAKTNSYWMWKIVMLLLIRGIVGCSADIFQYYSLKYLPLADSTVISFSTPIFVCVAAHFILGEKCGVVPILAAFITMLGVVVISRPPILTGEEEMNSNILMGNILALLCMICATFTTITMRCLKHVHFAMTMLALGIVGTLEGFVVTCFTSKFQFPEVESYQVPAMALIIATLFFFGQMAQTLALKHEEAGVVSLVRTCDVLFAFIWQVNLLNEKANLYSYIGAMVVATGVCITALRRWVSDMPENQAMKKRLSFILR